MTLAEEIRRNVKGDVSDAREELERASHDASIFEVTPELVIAPHSVHDVKALVRFVSERKREYPHLSLTARAAGTDMSGGPLSESIVLDFLKYFQGVRAVDAGRAEAEVLPGTYYRDFEKATLAKGLLLPCYPASRELCTVGGMVANNSGGEKTLTYGQTREYVRELSVVLSDGEEHAIRPLGKAELVAKIGGGGFEGGIYRQIYELVTHNKQLIEKSRPKTHKNSAGYALSRVWDGKIFDLAQLIVGSQGTLGIVTKIKFALVRPKMHAALLVIYLHELDKLSAVVSSVLAHKPESFESYDDHTFKLAVRFMPDIGRRLGVKGLINLGWQFLPELRMMLVGGVPKLIMVAEFTGESEEEVYKRAHAAERDLEEHELQTHVQKHDTHVAKDDREENKYWTIRRESFNLLREHVRGKHTAPFIDDIVVLPEHLPKFLPALTEIFSHYKIDYTIAGHIGEGNFHIIPLMDFNRPDFKQTISELSSKVYDLVGKFEGSITGEHNDGLIRTPFLDRMYNPAVLELFAEVKRIFDPQNIFNPGKKVPSGSPHAPGSLGYALSHLRHW